MINEKINDLDVIFGEGDLSKTNQYEQKKQLDENKLPLYITVLMYIYIYVPCKFQRFLNRLFSYINNINDRISI